MASKKPTAAEVESDAAPAVLPALRRALPDTREWHLTTAAARLYAASEEPRIGYLRNQVLDQAAAALRLAGEPALAQAVAAEIGGLAGASQTMALLSARVETLLRHEVAS